MVVLAYAYAYVTGVSIHVSSNDVFSVISLHRTHLVDRCLCCEPIKQFSLGKMLLSRRNLRGLCFISVLFFAAAFSPNSATTTTDRRESINRHLPQASIFNINEKGSAFGFDRNAEVWNGRVAQVRGCVGLRLVAKILLTSRFATLDCVRLGVHSRMESRERSFVWAKRWGHGEHGFFGNFHVPRLCVVH